VYPRVMIRRKEFLNLPLGQDPVPVGICGGKEAVCLFLCVVFGIELYPILFQDLGILLLKRR